MVVKKVEMEFKRVEGRHPGTGDPMVDFTCSHGGIGKLEIGCADEVLTLPDNEKNFTVRATDKGVQIFGHSPVVRDNFDLDPFAKAVGLAMREYVKLEMAAKKNPLKSFK